MRLSLAQIYQIFGIFHYHNLAGGAIEITDDWEKKNIVSVDLPILGKIRCHRLVKDQLWGAFDEMGRRGLAYLIDVKDTRTVGGCFVPRHEMHDPAKPLSRHSFGMAIDINPSRYPFGARTSQPVALVEIMRRWGFEVVVARDPMHFELVKLLNSKPQVEAQDMAQVEEEEDEMQSQYGIEHRYMVAIDNHRAPWLNLGNDNSADVDVEIVVCLFDSTKNSATKKRVAGFTAMKPGVDIRSLAREKMAGYSGVVMVTAKSAKSFVSGIETVAS